MRNDQNQIGFFCLFLSLLGSNVTGVFQRLKKKYLFTPSIYATASEIIGKICQLLPGKAKVLASETVDHTIFCDLSYSCGQDQR